MESKILRNKARCTNCNTVAESTNRHHLCFCECGKIFVDGGRAYLRRGGELRFMVDETEYEAEQKTPS